jgi:hypothetical protein
LQGRLSRVKRAYPAHVDACDSVLKACTDAVDHLMSEMERQNEEIAAEARRMEEEEEAKRREQAMKEEEVRNITRRLIELGHVPPPPPGCDFGEDEDEGEGEGEDEGEDEVEDNVHSTTESKPIVHNPVCFHCYFFFCD